jgi:CO/xanthine dehydrogenase FAD-binding subunit
MKPPAFDYILAESVDMAAAALARAGADAKIIAGGQSVGPGRYQPHRRPLFHRGDR